jgi:hypothetical protein
MIWTPWPPPAPSPPMLLSWVYPPASSGSSISAQKKEANIKRPIRQNTLRKHSLFLMFQSAHANPAKHVKPILYLVPNFLGSHSARSSFTLRGYPSHPRVSLRNAHINIANGHVNIRWSASSGTPHSLQLTSPFRFMALSCWAVCSLFWKSCHKKKTLIFNGILHPQSISATLQLTPPEVNCLSKKWGSSLQVFAAVDRILRRERSAVSWSFCTDAISCIRRSARTPRTRDVSLFLVRNLSHHPWNHLMRGMGCTCSLGLPSMLW